MSIIVYSNKNNSLTLFVLYLHVNIIYTYKGLLMKQFQYTVIILL